MINPTTGWFEIIEIANKQADHIANIFEQVWLSHYPWPAKIVMDQGQCWLDTELANTDKERSVVAKGGAIIVIQFKASSK
jgi:hypothetical protein